MRTAPPFFMEPNLYLKNGEAKYIMCIFLLTLFKPLLCLWAQCVSRLG